MNKLKPFGMDVWMCVYEMLLALSWYNFRVLFAYDDKADKMTRCSRPEHQFINPAKRFIHIQTRYIFIG